MSALGLRALQMGCQLRLVVRLLSPLIDSMVHRSSFTSQSLVGGFTCVQVATHIFERLHSASEAWQGRLPRPLQILKFAIFQNFFLISSSFCIPTVKHCICVSRNNILKCTIQALTRIAETFTSVLPHLPQPRHTHRNHGVRFPSRAEHTSGH